MREAVKRFPDEDPMRLGFQYARQDVRFPSDIALAFEVRHIAWKDGWAWVEVTGENYVADIAALLQKEGSRWYVRGIVNPAYVTCPDEHACLDVLAYLYRIFQAKAAAAPRDIFPEGDAACAAEGNPCRAGGASGKGVRNAGRQGARYGAPTQSRWHGAVRTRDGGYAEGKEPFGVSVR